jgi:hypothetical protein
LYGADGYDLSQGAITLPSYAQVTVSGQSNYTWAASTSDPRALQKPGASDRLAATWYSNSSFTVDINLTDGQAHQVALYLLDWDYGGARSERLDVLDAATGQVLDTRSAASFVGGQYVVWSLRGHVQIRLTTLTGNAVLSGIFFGGPASASLQGTPSETRGAVDQTSHLTTGRAIREFVTSIDLIASARRDEPPLHDLAMPNLDEPQFISSRGNVNDCALDSFLAEMPHPAPIFLAKFSLRKIAQQR